jgi:hypothetical protein
MKIIHSIFYPFKIFSKGMFLLFSINLLIVSFVFIFDSCKKYNSANSPNGIFKNRFLKSIELNKVNIGSIPFIVNTGIHTSIFGTTQQSGNQINDNETIYLNFPIVNNSNNFLYNTTSIKELSNLINSSNTVVQYEPNANNINNQLHIPIELIVSSLSPLIIESKEYLHNKGFSDQEIRNMLDEENGKDEDLILFVMSLIQAETNPPISYNLNPLFINAVQAKLDANDYIRCAVISIGADVLWSLGTSNSSKWTKVAMKKAFGIVAKKMLGPIGVGIAVVSFSICLTEAYYN